MAENETTATSQTQEATETTAETTDQTTTETTETSETSTTETDQTTSETTETSETSETTEATETTEDAPVNAPGDYQLTLPEGRVEDKALVGGLRQVAFANGFSQAEFNAIVDLHEQGVAAQMEAQTELQAGWEADLKQRWKDDFGPNTEAARDFVKKFGNEGLNKLVDQTGFLKNPDIAEMFLMLNKAVSEDSLILGEGKSGSQMVKARSPGGTPMLSFPSMAKK